FRHFIAATAPPAPHPAPTRRSSDLVTDQAETRDKEAFMRQHFGCSEGIIAEVGWGATPDQCAVLAFCAATYEGDYRRFERHDRRSEEHTSELQSRENLVCRLLLEEK